MMVDSNEKVYDVRILAKNTSLLELSNDFGRLRFGRINA
jgi:hypothetical protein